METFMKCLIILCLLALILMVGIMMDSLSDVGKEAMATRDKISSLRSDIWSASTANEPAKQMGVLHSQGSTWFTYPAPAAPADEAVVKEEGFRINFSAPSIDRGFEGAALPKGKSLRIEQQTPSGKWVVKDTLSGVMKIRFVVEGDK